MLQIEQASMILSGKLVLKLPLQREAIATHYNALHEWNNFS